MRVTVIRFLLLVFGSIFFDVNESRGWNCEQLRSNIWYLLEKDYCERAGDCVSVQLARPFGCNRHINEEILPDLEDTWDKYNRLCGPFLYNCLAPDISLKCVDHRCEGRRRIARVPSIGTLNQHGRPYHRR